MIELEQTIDDISKVEEVYRPLYEEKDGKFTLGVTVKGYKPEADVTRVHTALVKERNDHSQTKLKLKPFEGLGNVDEVQAQLARIPELEIAAEGRIDDKKIDKLVETRITTRLAPVQRERDQLKTTVDDLNKTITGFQALETTRTLHDAVRSAASKVKLRESAVDDALLVAERMLEVDATTKTVTVKDGFGITPGVTAEIWLQEMVNKRPHWFPDSVGGGAGGNNGNNSGLTNNPFSHDHWNMSEQGKIYLQNPGRADQLARAAGTTVGGGRPAPSRK